MGEKPYPEQENWHVTEAEIPSGEIMVLGGEGFDFGCVAVVTEMKDAHVVAAAPDLFRELRASPCPRPCNGRQDDLTVGACCDSGECGCSMGAAIKKAGGPQ